VAQSKQHRPWRLLVVALTLVAVAIIGYALHPLLIRSPDRLLAEAYTERRTLELRIEGAHYAPVRFEAKTLASSLDQPQPFLQAEARIGHLMQQQPDIPTLLSARGRARLLKWSYETAIIDLQQALDSEQTSTVVLNDLASAHFERAESERRFSDYGIAFELQSRALQTQPDNLVVLFNRAITAERLFLFERCFEDWEHYLRLDPSGEWSNEARVRLGRVQKQFESHEQRTHEPLLTPAQFVEEVTASNPLTWNLVEPRIEQYLSKAITDWLPAAFPPGGDTPLSIATRRSLKTLAVILRKRHGDSWLTEVLPIQVTPRFRKAVVALSRAARADNVSEDFASGRKESILAAKLFRSEGNTAGAIRAQFEEIYALHFSDAGPECVRKISLLSPFAIARPYPWIQVQLKLEKKVCLNIESALGPSRDSAGEALNAADSARYAALSLRAIGFLGDAERVAGRRRAVWELCNEGLRRYWAGLTQATPGYNLYILAKDTAEEEELWNLDIALSRQALRLISPAETPLTQAALHAYIALIATRIHSVQIAQDSLSRANQLLSTAPQTEATENYRVGIGVDLARIETLLGHPQSALARLADISAQISTISNDTIAAEYYRTLGGAQADAGDLRASEAALQVAVLLAEEQRVSLKTEVDRISWAHDSVDSYAQLVEAKVASQDSMGALAIWEMFRDAGLRHATIRARNSSLGTSILNPQVDLLRLAMLEEMNLAKGCLLFPADRAVITYALLSHGLAIWLCDERGVTYRWVGKDPAQIRSLARRFAELCATPTSPLVAIRTFAQQLHRILIAPVADRLRPGATLVIDADEALSGIAFQALLDMQGQYLAWRHPLVYSLGLRYLATLNENDPPFTSDMKTLAVAGTAIGQGAELRPLADAVAEATSVGSRFHHSRLLAGNEASLAAVRAGLLHSEIFHFAGHAGTMTGRKGLLLASDTKRERTSVFDSSVLEGDSLPSVRLAVLSACSTESGSRGNMLDSESLALAFLRAGVPHVVATRWDVDSASSAALMRLFYDELLSGEPVAKALADAETRIRERAAHPYYWAAFDAFGM
jgi:CHAT domain-containing protein